MESSRTLWFPSFEELKASEAREGATRERCLVSIEGIVRDREVNGRWEGKEREESIGKGQKMKKSAHRL